MTWSLIFSLSTYLAAAIIVISVILRFFRKFRLYIPIIIALLLLVSVGGTYAIGVRDMTVAEVMARFNIASEDDVAMIRKGNNLLLYIAMITDIVVYGACAVEGLSRGIKYLFRRLKKRKEARK